jgi:hypothetical protein
MAGKMGPLFPKVVPYEKQARLRLFGGGLSLEVDKQMEINHPILLISSTQHHKHGAYQH